MPYRVVGCGERIAKRMKIVPYILCLQIALNGFAQLPIVRATKPLATIRVGNSLPKNNWSILPATRPDVYEANVEGAATNVQFITDIDSIGFSLKPGQTYPFVVLLNGRDSAFTEIKGIAYTKPAHFTDAYKKANKGKTRLEIPPVYELVNVLLALTPTFQKDSGIISRQPPYYPTVMHYFSPYRDEPAVSLMDSLVRTGHYFDIKMDAYSFELDTKGQLIRSAVYDRINWGRTNRLLPYIDRLQQFSDKVHFPQFYQQNRVVYTAQIATYRDSLQVGEMVTWLNKHFPGTRYNAFKVIWSPLVGNNQSATWLEDNGFREMQAHVNFPYRSITGLADVSTRSNQVKRGNIVFTEINHAFINPEGEKSQYAQDINRTFANVSRWAEGLALKNYGNAYACFNEYMNWGLVSLRYIDYADRQDLEKLFSNVETTMVKRRGFYRFTDFNRYLIGLYQTRKSGTTLADLYPQIVAWFDQQK